jgi:hypothetical protein
LNRSKNAIVFIFQLLKVNFKWKGSLTYYLWIFKMSPCVFFGTIVLLHFVRIQFCPRQHLLIFGTFSMSFMCFCIWKSICLPQSIGYLYILVINTYMLEASMFYYALSFEMTQCLNYPIFFII